MKLVFVSNYFNHHQKPLSDRLYEILRDDYAFIETTKMTPERIGMGWGDIHVPNYVKYYYENKEAETTCQELIDHADVIVTGSAPEKLLKTAIRNKTVVFRYSERPVKDKNLYYIKYLARFIKWHMVNKHSSRIFLLCASAYSSYDYSRFLLFKNRSYKWGYFPETRYYDNISDVIYNKSNNSILWVARLIDWKHPEHAIEVARRLKTDGVPFSMNIIGNGELEETVRNQIKKHNLQNEVRMVGAVKPTEVRKYMENSEIFLFTSDHNEGWGAVLNEAMNSACAVVANARIGSAPFLVEDGNNGLLYDEGDIDQLYEKTKILLQDAALRKRLSENAYEKISQHWNAEYAALNLISTAEACISNGVGNLIEEYEVCSIAKPMKDDWFSKAHD